MAGAWRAANGPGFFKPASKRKNLRSREACEP